MQVSKENLKVWRKFTINGTYEGTFMKLVKESGLNYRTVKKAVESGDASPEVISAINNAAKKLDTFFKKIQAPII